MGPYGRLRADSRQQRETAQSRRQTAHTRDKIIRPFAGSQLFFVFDIFSQVFADILQLMHMLVFSIELKRHEVLWCILALLL
jgi:hypothetical protein